MNWKPDICIYHFPCDDGFGAAWSVWKRWGRNVEYCPRNYGQEPPSVDGKNVLIADFSFKPSVLQDMAKTAKSIVVLDHHKTAHEDLQAFSVKDQFNASSLAPVADWQGRYSYDDAYPGRRSDFGALIVPKNIIAKFDMGQSGAMLTWKFCHPDKLVPLLIQLIQDRDLWQMKMANTRRFSLWLRSHAFDFSTWDEIGRAMDSPAELNILLQEATAIERFYDRKVDEVVSAAGWGNIGGFDVPVANAPWFMASNVDHELLQRHQDADFSAVWYESYGARTYSLRSADDREDCSAIARKYGGGGHRNAAGFRVPA